MGNSICKIEEGFFICGVDALRDFERLRRLGIRCVLNAAQRDLYTMGDDPSLARIEDEFEVKIIGAEDAEDCNLSVRFNEIADFIEGGRAKGGVVVHCAAGISRASTSSMAYLMIKENWELNAAFMHVHCVRTFIRPNVGFWRQLRDLEQSLKARGVELKPLPAGWEPTLQPPDLQEGDDPKAPSASRPQDPVAKLAQLDDDAAHVPSFVTKYITACLKCSDGVSPQDLERALRIDKPKGISVEQTSFGAAEVTLRVGICASLDTASLKTLLETLPGVQRATCE